MEKMRNIIVLLISITLNIYLQICNGASNKETLRPVVKTESGKVRGMRSFVTNQQIPVDKFFGIPYAQPPLGERRFKRPMPVSSWTGIRDAAQFSSACYQPVQKTGFRGDDMWMPTMPLSEDCLYLNIWVPRNIRESMTNLTVLVWIHAGGFFSGSADLDVYDGSLLSATNNVIVASMNYRLGPFGFLYLGSPGAPGNMGLLDQQLALKWIFENIEHFGGDRKKITIFGVSAGSAGVSYHLLSPTSWDYFNSAIMEGGTALCPWTFRSPNDIMQLSREYSHAAQCSAGKTEELLDCLSEKSAEHLLKHWVGLQPTSTHILFTPTVDGEFIDKPPEQIIREKEFKRCNIMIGYNTDEQTIFMYYADPSKFGRNLSKPLLSSSELGEFINRVSFSVIPPLSKGTLDLNSTLYVYYDSVPEEIRGSNYDVLDDIVGDYDLKCPIVQFAVSYATENLGVYFYHFDHLSIATNPWPEWMGVKHAYEVEFLFGWPYNKSLGYSTEDTRITDLLMSYWVTFASKGNPNTATTSSDEEFWPNFRTTQQKYKLLKGGSLKTKQFPRYRECSFWRDFIPTLEQYSEATALQLARCSGGRSYSYAGSLGIFMCFLYPIFSAFW